MKEFLKKRKYNNKNDDMPQVALIQMDKQDALSKDYYNTLKEKAIKEEESKMVILA